MSDYIMMLTDTFGCPCSLELIGKYKICPKHRHRTVSLVEDFLSIMILKLALAPCRGGQSIFVAAAQVEIAMSKTRHKRMKGLESIQVMSDKK